ncbi:hypothetical protein RclHR1_33930001, partial [Rhizophagus clarus]
PEHRRSETPFRGGPLNLKLHFEADNCLKVLYRQTTTELFRRSRTLIRSGLRPEEADRGILKIQNLKWTEDGPHLAADQVSSQR